MLNRRTWIQGAASAATALCGVGSLSAQQQQQQQTPARIVYIKNLHCEGCAKRLRNSVFKVADVLKVQTSVKKGVAVVTPTQSGNPSAKAIWEAIEKEKFQITKLVTPAGTYTQKPAA